MSPLLLGHRGAPREAPENTLAAFEAARQAGLDGVELDVRRLADGQLAVHHDPHLADGRALIHLRRSELPAQVPTLPEVLAWAHDTGAYLNVEIKWETDTPGQWRPDDRVGRTLDLLRVYGLEGRCVLSSFNPLILRAARDRAPGIERGLLYDRPLRLGGLDALPRVARLVDAAALHPHHRLVDAPLMELARARGWWVNTWTVNEGAEVARLVALGVDALIGDLPGVLLGARGPSRTGASQTGPNQTGPSQTGTEGA